MDKLSIIKGSDIKAIIDLFKEKEREVSHEECADQYDVTKHKIFDETARPNKIVNQDVVVDGVVQTDSNGNAMTTSVPVPVSRIGIPFQQQIVEQRIGFMLSVPVNYNMFSKSAKGKKLIERVEYIQKKNRMDFRNKEILRRQMSEMECAELWYLVPEDEGADTKFTLRCKLLSPALGDTLLPLYNNIGDMIAFARSYKTKEGDTETEHFSLYTAEFEAHYINQDGWKLEPIFDINGNSVANPLPNTVGKIMIIYHEQGLPEWYNSQSMIERYEISVSNHADMNDYFGSPILAVSGEVQGFVAKGTQGQILELSADARANYLQLTTPPESILKEQDRLRELILALCNTADISFDKVKGIGNLSAIALNLLFISSTMAAKTKEETFAISLQRRLNLLMTAIGKVIDTSLAKAIKEVTSSPEVIVYQPKDEIEFQKMLGLAVKDGILSPEQAVMLSSLIVDKNEEIKRLTKLKLDGVTKDENNIENNVK